MEQSSKIFAGLVDAPLYEVRLSFGCGQFGASCDCTGRLRPDLMLSDATLVVGWTAACSVFRRALLRRPHDRFAVVRVCSSMVSPSLLDGLHMLDGSKIDSLDDWGLANSLSNAVIADVESGGLVETSWSAIEADAYFDAWCI